MISGNYRELHGEEIYQVTARCAAAWQDPRIPRLQSEVALPEIERFKNGESVAPFDAFIRCWNQMSLPVAYWPTVLDVGASAGYYKQILEIAGRPFRYTGIDFSQAFKTLGRELYPGIDLHIGDARAIPFLNNEFDVVFSGACIMHIAEYQKVIQEASRVSRKYVIFSRTPITEGPTRFFSKEAYGIECLEIWFNEAELFKLFAYSNLSVVYSTDVFHNAEFRHRTYLLEKGVVLAHHPV